LATPYIRTDDEARRHVRDILGIGPSQDFAVLHVSGSTPKKDWQNHGWIEIAKKLSLQGLIPVFTGAGLEQEKSILEITTAVDGSINICGKLTWNQLVAVIEQASLVVCVDTSIGHLAAALGIPCTSLLSGMQDYKLWRPVGQRNSWVTHELACNPCFNKNGCEHMSCVRKITVAQVEKSISEVLKTT
jgi:ADP-heptose:LPS heptosyltransferase